MGSDEATWEHNLGIKTTGGYRLQSAAQHHEIAWCRAVCFFWDVMAKSRRAASGVTQKMMSSFYKCNVILFCMKNTENLNFFVSGKKLKACSDEALKIIAGETHACAPGGGLV